MKDSFIFYNDFFEVLFALDDTARAEILRAMQAHVQGKQYQLPRGLDVVFIPIRQKLDKDNIKYQETCLARSNAGKKGGRPSKSQQAAKAGTVVENQKLSSKAKKTGSEYEYDSGLLSDKADNNIEKGNTSSNEETKEKEFSEKFREIKAALINSPIWVNTMMKNHRIPDGGMENALDRFHDHIVRIGKEASLTDIREAKMWFNSWAAKGYLQQTLSTAVLGKGEFIENGRRVFRWGKNLKEVPPDAPPRPSESDCWNQEEQRWFFAED